MSVYIFQVGVKKTTVWPSILVLNAGFACCYHYEISPRQMTLNKHSFLKCSAET